jgi:hypothetical protein
LIAQGGDAALNTHALVVEGFNIVKFQVGSYLGEDDILQILDGYNRV